MPRQYPIEKVRDIGIVAHIDASSLDFARDSLKPIGFSISATGKLLFSRSRVTTISSQANSGSGSYPLKAKTFAFKPLSRINVRVFLAN